MILSRHKRVMTTHPDKSGGLRARQKAQRQQKILDAARAVFFDKGRSAATIEEISAGAEVSALTVFNYFGDKDALFVAAWTRMRAEEHAALGRFLDSADAGDPLALLDSYLTRLMAPEGMAGLHESMARRLWCDFQAASFARRARNGAEVVQTEDRMILDELGRIFARGVAAGAVPPDAPLADLAEGVLAIGNLHWTRWLTGEQPDGALRHRETLRQVRLFVAPLLATGAPGETG